MPNIKGIDLSDGIKILSGERNTPDAFLDLASVQNYLAHHTVEQTQSFCDSYLENVIKTEQVRVHIYSVSPLRYNIIVANYDVVIPANWWE